MQKYYKVLEVRYDAPLSEIKQAYRDLVRVWHPDRYAGDERLQKRATEKLIEINEAYRVLRSFTPEFVSNIKESEGWAEPINWSRYTKSDEPETSSTSSNPVRREDSSKWHWSYAVVGVTIVCLAVFFLLGAHSSQAKYTPTTFPPPLSHVSALRVGDHLNADSATVLPPIDLNMSPIATPLNTQMVGNNYETHNSSADNLSRSPIDSVSDTRR